MKLLLVVALLVIPCHGRPDPFNSYNIQTETENNEKEIDMLHDILRPLTVKTLNGAASDDSDDSDSERSKVKVPLLRSIIKPPRVGSDSDLSSTLSEDAGGSDSKEWKVGVPFPSKSKKSPNIAGGGGDSDFFSTSSDDTDDSLNKFFGPKRVKRRSPGRPRKRGEQDFPQIPFENDDDDDCLEMASKIGTCTLSIPTNMERRELRTSVTFSEDVYGFKLVKPLSVMRGQDRQERRATRDIHDRNFRRGMDRRGRFGPRFPRMEPIREFMVTNRLPMLTQQYTMMFKYWYDTNNEPAASCSFIQPAPPPPAPTSAVTSPPNPPTPAPTAAVSSPPSPSSAATMPPTTLPSATTPPGPPISFT